MCCNVVRHAWLSSCSPLWAICLPSGALAAFLVFVVVGRVSPRLNPLHTKLGVQHYINLYLASGDDSYFSFTKKNKSILILILFRPQVERHYPLNLSILISGGKETNRDSLSSGERSGRSPSSESGRAHLSIAPRIVVSRLASRTRSREQKSLGKGRQGG
jgi:hypothetical protein